MSSQRAAALSIKSANGCPALSFSLCRCPFPLFLLLSDPPFFLCSDEFCPLIDLDSIIAMPWHGAGDPLVITKQGRRGSDTHVRHPHDLPVCENTV